jgi:DNA-binding NtrC family response regulator
MEKRVLVVEDNQMLGELLVLLLQTKGYQVDYSEDCVDALLRLGSNIRYDLAILDYWLKDLGSGKDIERVLKKLDIKAFYYTGHEDIETDLPVLSKIVDGPKKVIQQVVSMIGEAPVKDNSGDTAAISYIKRFDERKRHKDSIKKSEKNSHNILSIAH